MKNDKKTLNQIVAIEKGVKSRVYSKVTELHKQSQKADPFNGFTKTYRAKDDDGEQYPPESKKVKLVAADILKEVAKHQTEVFDVTATKDWANCSARADVVVDGQTLLPDVPVTYLLFLEKQLSDMRKFVDELPPLDDGKDWEADPNSKLYRTEKVITHKTKKVQRPIVLYDAVVKDDQALPAQTQLITEDVVIGWWDTAYLSGAIPAPRKDELLERIDAVTKAVKQARERANSMEVDEVEVGAAFFKYLFG